MCVCVLCACAEWNLVCVCVCMRDVQRGILCVCACVMCGEELCVCVCVCVCACVMCTRFVHGSENVLCIIWRVPKDTLLTGFEMEALFNLTNIYKAILTC